MLSQISCTKTVAIAKKTHSQVVLSPQHKEILDKHLRQAGQSESETLRIGILEYAKSISLITEKVHAQHC